MQVHGEEIVRLPTLATSSSSCDLESKGKEAESKAQHNMYAMVWGELKASVKEKKIQKKFTRENSWLIEGGMVGGP